MKGMRINQAIANSYYYIAQRKQLSRFVFFITFIALIYYAIFWRLVFIKNMGSPDYLTWATQNYFGSISSFYLTMAQELLAGNSYNSIAYPPGYPLFIVFCYKLLGYLGVAATDHVTGLRIIQACLDTLNLIALYSIFRWLRVRPLLGLVGCFIFAACSIMAFNSTYVMAESLSPTFIIWIIFLMLHASRARFLLASGLWLLTGILVGFAGITRPDLILLILPVALWALWRSYRYMKVLAIVCLCLGFASVVGSWALQAHRISGQWMLTSTSGGNTLWEGLGEIKNNYGYVADDAVAGEVAKAHQISDMHSHQGNQLFTQLYWQAWRDHPFYVMQTIVYRWIKIMLPHLESIRLLNQLFVLQQILVHLMLLPFLLAFMMHARNKPLLFILGLPLFYAFFSIGLVHYESRYTRYVFISFLFGTLLFLEYLFTHVLAVRLVETESN